MKAAVLRQFGAPLTIEDVTLAEPAHDEVLVRLKACAICHSDIVFAEGGWGGQLPMVLGHEAAGVVERVGPSVSPSVKPGDHVVVTLIRSCGYCHYCSGGSQVLCEAGFALDHNSPLHDADGGTLTHGLRTGAFAEQVVVHASQIVRIPQDIPFASASLLACGVITGFGAVRNTAKMPAGSHAVVIGCGGVGMNAIQGARICGARTITAIDVSDSKLEAARKFGATHTVNPLSGDAVKDIMKITAGRGADHVFVTVGSPQVIDGASSYIAKAGTIVIAGMPADGAMSQFDAATLAAWQQRIIGSKMGSSRIAQDIPYLVDLYQTGQLMLDELVSGTFALDEINAAILSTKSGEALRNVVVFG